MIKRSPQVLADAVIVIGAHEHKYWEPLCNRYKIGIPATILEDELFYFHSPDGNTQGLAPTQWVKEGKVERLEADVEDFQRLHQKLSKQFMYSLDPGELEALALLGSAKYKDSLFSTADRAAIRALGILAWRARGISVEKLLNGAGKSGAMIKHLPQHFTERWF